MNATRDATTGGTPPVVTDPRNPATHNCAAHPGCGRRAAGSVSVDHAVVWTCTPTLNR
jgi:hypothetical protein